MNHLCNNYEFHGWEPVITVLLGTGMRIGECLGLCWSDLDFEKRIIKVCKTLTYRPEPNGEYRKGESIYRRVSIKITPFLHLCVL